MVRRRPGFVVPGALIPLLVPGARCGGDGSSLPTTSGDPAAPSPALPPVPTVRGLTITTAPFDPRGYAVGETIGVQITFSEAVTVSGTSLLKLGIEAALNIGDHAIAADAAHRVIGAPPERE